MDENYTRLANNILESLCSCHLTQHEWRVLMCLFRKTYGHQKKDDWIAAVQITEMTGIHKAHVSRALKLLKLRNMVTPRGNKIGFNKYQSQWRELPHGVTNHSVTPRGTKVTPRGTKVTPRGTKVTPRGNRKLPHGADTKETLTKETIQKKGIPSEYGNAGVNTIMQVMGECFGNLDGTKAKNRQYAWLLLKKAKSLKKDATEEDALRACVQLVRAASQHNWWKSRITKTEDLFRNAHKISNAVKESLAPKIAYI